MPVKVRCTSCKKVLTAPDAARGKAIKCRHCEARVRVPTGKGKPKPKRTAGSRADASPQGEDADHHDVLANLNLKNLEDTSVRICPKCGTEVTEEDGVECPNCGLDIETGKLTVQAQRRKARESVKGPDPAEFYGVAWSDSFAFIKKNKALVIRTMLYWLIFSSLAIGCGFMMLWCHRTPPKAFWGFCGFVAVMVAPGWTWFLHTLIINATLDRREDFKRINFDIFLSSALGIKLFAWQIALIQVATGTIGLVFINKGDMLIGGLCIGFGALVCIALAPIAMVHMSMPITYRGWVLPAMVQVFVKVTGPSLYWAVLFLTVNIPAIAGVSVIAAVYGDEINGVVTALRFNSNVAAAADKEKPKTAEAQEEAANDPLEAFRDAELKPVDGNSLVIPGVIWLVTVICFGVSSVFSMRANGVFAVYFKRDLDLLAQAKETVYVTQTNTDDIPTIDDIDFDKIQLATSVVLGGLVVTLISNLLPLLGGLASGIGAFLLSNPYVFIVASILGAVIGIVGRCICISVPRDQNIKTAIGMAVVFDAVAVALAAVRFVPGTLYEFVPAFQEHPALHSLAIVGCTLLGRILFVMFLSHLAELMERDDLRKLGILIMSLLGVVFVCLIVMVVDPFVEVDLKARICGAVSSLLALAGGVMYVLLLLQTKSALDEARVRVERRRRKREKMAKEENDGH